jgi:hypothetical protein
MRRTLGFISLSANVSNRQNERAGEPLTHCVKRLCERKAGMLDLEISEGDGRGPCEQ